jgi:hypothetical protein
MFDLGNNVDHVGLKMMIPSKHAPTPILDVNETIGELITLAVVLAEKMVVRFDCDDDKEANEGLDSLESKGNFSI